MTAVLVRCEDGQQRHADPFPTLQDACRWACWGHICTRTHTYHQTTEED